VKIVSAAIATFVFVKSWANILFRYYLVLLLFAILSLLLLLWAVMNLLLFKIMLAFMLAHWWTLLSTTTSYINHSSQNLLLMT